MFVALCPAKLVHQCSVLAHSRDLHLSCTLNACVGMQMHTVNSRCADTSHSENFVKSHQIGFDCQHSLSDLQLTEFDAGKPFDQCFVFFLCSKPLVDAMENEAGKTAMFFCITWELASPKVECCSKRGVGWKIFVFARAQASDEQQAVCCETICLNSANEDTDMFSAVQTSDSILLHHSACFV